jgi:MFS family permease
MTLALQQRGFRVLWLAQTVSLTGSQVTELAVPLTAVITLRATAFQAGVLGALETLPILLVGPFMGPLVDHARRRPLLLAANVWRCACLATIPIAAVAGFLSMWQLYLVALLVGTAGIMFDVALLSTIPDMVPRDALTDANSKLEMSDSVTSTVGPGIAGLLVQMMTPPIAVAADAASYALAAILIRAAAVADPASSLRRLALRRLLAETGLAFSHVLRHPVLRPLVLTAAVFQLFYGAILAIYVLFVVRVLHLAPWVIGLIYSVGSLGPLTASLIATRARRALGPERLLLGSALIAEGSTLLIPFATGPQAAMVVILVLARGLGGFGAVLYQVSQVTLRQLITPPEMQGRVNATMRVIEWGALPMGALSGGALGTWVGLRGALIVAALGTLGGFPILLRFALSGEHGALLRAGEKSIDESGDASSDAAASAPRGAARRSGED